MGTAGRPHPRLIRALATRNVHLVDAAAAECERVDLEDALAICLLYAEQAPERFPRAAARFLERAIAETRCSITAASMLATALAGAPDPLALAALAEILDGLGLSRAAEVVDSGADR